jgi:hypothetical protein
LLGEKPALLFPIGWQIAIHLGWSRRKQKRPFFGGDGFWEQVLGKIPECNAAEK